MDITLRTRLSRTTCRVKISSFLIFVVFSCLISHIQAVSQTSCFCPNQPGIITYSGACPFTNSMMVVKRTLSVKTRSAAPSNFCAQQIPYNSADCIITDSYSDWSVKNFCNTRAGQCTVSYSLDDQTLATCNSPDGTVYGCLEFDCINSTNVGSLPNPTVYLSSSNQIRYNLTTSRFHVMTSYYPGTATTLINQCTVEVSATSTVLLRINDLRGDFRGPAPGNDSRCPYVLYFNTGAAYTDWCAGRNWGYSEMQVSPVGGSGSRTIDVVFNSPFVDQLVEGALWITIEANTDRITVRCGDNIALYPVPTQTLTRSVPSTTTRRQDPATSTTTATSATTTTTAAGQPGQPSTTTTTTSATTTTTVAGQPGQPSTTTTTSTTATTTTAIGQPGQPSTTTTTTTISAATTTTVAGQPGQPSSSTSSSTSATTSTTTTTTSRSPVGPPGQDSTSTASSSTTTTTTSRSPVGPPGQDSTSTASSSTTATTTTTTTTTTTSRSPVGPPGQDSTSTASSSTATTTTTTISSSSTTTTTMATTTTTSPVGPPGQPSTTTASSTTTTTTSSPSSSTTTATTSSSTKATSTLQQGQPGQSSTTSPAAPPGQPSSSTTTPQPPPSSSTITLVGPPGPPGTPVGPPGPDTTSQGPLGPGSTTTLQQGSPPSTTTAKWFSPLSLTPGVPTPGVPKDLAEAQAADFITGNDNHNVRVVAITVACIVGGLILLVLIIMALIWFFKFRHEDNGYQQGGMNSMSRSNYTATIE